MRRLALAAAALALVASSACSSFNDARGRGDAPVGNRDEQPRDVVFFPDGYSNIAHACDGHGHRIFVTTQNGNGKFLVVLADPTCPGGSE